MTGSLAVMGSRHMAQSSGVSAVSEICGWMVEAIFLEFG